MENKIKISKKLLPMINGGYRYNIAYGGRASTKSWGIGSILLLKSMTEKALILCTKGTMRSISDSVKSLLEGLIVMNGWDDFFYITDKEIVNKQTGSKFIFYGLQNPDRLKSLENVKYCWIEEAAVDVSEKALEVLFPTIRAPGSQIFITFNPMFETDAVYQKFLVEQQQDALVVEINYYDNPHLSNEIKNQIKHDKETNLIKYNHVWEGKILQEVKGALWTKDLIKYINKDEWAKYNLLDFNFKKTIVSVDPSTTDGAKSDACGIVVMAEIADDEYIILEDATEVLSPEGWGNKAIALYNKWNANYILYEKNQGGQMSETIINQIDRNIKCVSVHASKSKIIRAEPIQLLYERGLVKHLKHFPILESEMLTYNGKGKSPNAYDSLVHGLTNLSSRANAPRGMRQANMGRMVLKR